MINLKGYGRYLFWHILWYCYGIDLERLRKAKKNQSGHLITRPEVQTQDLQNVKQWCCIRHTVYEYFDAMCFSHLDSRKSFF
jgi:hypothetical protein